MAGCRKERSQGGNGGMRPPPVSLPSPPQWATSEAPGPWGPYCTPSVWDPHQRGTQVSGLAAGHPETCHDPPCHVQHRAPEDRQTHTPGQRPPQHLGDPYPISGVTSAPPPPPSLGANTLQQGASTPCHNTTPKKAPKVTQLTPNCPTAGVPPTKPPPRATSTVGQGGCKGHLGAGRREQGAPGTRVHSLALARRVARRCQEMPGRLGLLAGGDGGGGQRPGAT